MHSTKFEAAKQDTHQAVGALQAGRADVLPIDDGRRFAGHALRGLLRGGGRHVEELDGWYLSDGWVGSKGLMDESIGSRMREFEQALPIRFDWPG